MNKFAVLIIISLFFIGCAGVCKQVTPEKMAQINQTIDVLQADYEGLMAIYEKDPNPEFKRAMIAAKLLLNTYLAVQSTWCDNPDVQARENALVKAKNKAFNVNQ